MRLKASLAVLAAVGGAFLAAAPASAITCPPGTQYEPHGVGGVYVSVCWPRVQCDPAACLVVLP
ncbi:MAG TPA: hypothetical protein VGX28_00970 [Frankiaceae bacterium]|jgi:hypothetical protein|nr:hypothetical protein [Frankiaceae bacterium]